MKLASGALSVTIDSDITSFNINSQSEEVHVTLDYPIFEDLHVEFSVEAYDGTARSDITVDPPNLTFSKGEQVKTIVIRSAADSEGGWSRLLTSLNGGGCTGNFVVANPTVEFEVLAEVDTLAPEVHDVRVQSISRKSAKLRANCSEMSNVYYSYSKRGTRTPDATNVINNVQIENDVDQWFGSLQTDSNKVAKIKLTDLAPSTWYTIFIVAQDMTQNVSEEVESLDFKTVKRHNPARFRLFCTVLNSVSIVTNALARVLAIPVEYLTFIGTDPSLLNRRLTDGQSHEYEYLLSLNDDYEDSPTELAETLGRLGADLVSNIPGYDESQDISDTVTEMNGTSPDFHIAPVITEANEDVLTVQAALNTAGQICGIALLKSDADPKTEQIRAGLNAFNEAVADGLYTCSSAIYQTPATITFSSLDTQQEYYIWITGENDMPEPELMEDYHV